MDKKTYDRGRIDIAWCPGCGNFSILEILKSTLAGLDIPPEDVVLVSGIGQAAKIPHYLRCHYFNGLHGRAVPPATAIKAVNPKLTVIAESGDGDMYGEGGNHLVHAIRRNPDITVIVHDNMVYGLTKGQASPTSAQGFRTPVQVRGVVLEPLNPVALAVAMGASFVARAFSGDAAETGEILKRAVSHKGLALVDIFQPCVSFNKTNTHRWFKENTYYLADDHDRTRKTTAFERASETGPLPLGIFYIDPDRPSFEDRLGLYEKDPTPLALRDVNRTERLDELIESKIHFEEIHS